MAPDPFSPPVLIERTGSVLTSVLNRQEARRVTRYRLPCSTQWGRRCEMKSNSLPRHPFQNRPGHGYRPRREERDPDRRIRDRGTGARTEHLRSCSCRREVAAASDPDDLDGVHPRCAPTRGIDRCRRSVSPWTRHRRHRRHARGNRTRAAVDPCVLCFGQAVTRGQIGCRRWASAGALTPAGMGRSCGQGAELQWILHAG